MVMRCVGALFLLKAKGLRAASKITVFASHCTFLGMDEQLKIPLINVLQENFQPYSCSTICCFESVL
jgi:hypothetical protein